MAKTLSHARNAPEARRTNEAPSRARRRGLALALLVLLTGALACGSSETTPQDAARQAREAFVWPTDSGTRVELEIEGRGVIEIVLYPELAPKTVENFVKLAREGYYAGTTFHRVIPEFMIQGGDPNTKDANPKDDGNGGPGYRIDDEHNDASHLRGVISMANSGHANTGGSQFFIIQRDAPHLDGKHTIFGRVIRGLEIVDAIATVETDAHGRWGPRNRPIENQVVARVTVREAAPDAPGVAEAASGRQGTDAS